MQIKAEIQYFWLSLTPAVFSKYTGHLHEVIPKVIKVTEIPVGSRLALNINTTM